jgi:hypothetical protein
MMIGYMDIEEQVDYDFTCAVRRSFVHRVRARLRGDSSASRVPSFEKAVRDLGARNKLRLGRRVIAVEKVVGSVGRFRDFDGEFLPTRRSVGERWKWVDRAFHRGVDLPPVELYKIGEGYYVLDGNHRISVARFQGVRWIEAEVTQLYVGKSPTSSACAAVDQKTENVPHSTAA